MQLVQKGVAEGINRTAGDRKYHQAADQTGEEDGERKAQKEAEENGAHRWSGNFCSSGVQIADTADGLDAFHPMELMAQFFPQTADMDVNAAIEQFQFAPEHFLGKIFSGDHLADALDQGMEQEENSTAVSTTWFPSGTRMRVPKSKVISSATNLPAQQGGSPSRVAPVAGWPDAGQISRG
jgi:hypothetical protein